VTRGYTRYNLYTTQEIRYSTLLEAHLQETNAEHKSWARLKQ